MQYKLKLTMNHHSIIFYCDKNPLIIHLSYIIIVITTNILSIQYFFIDNMKINDFSLVILPS